MKIGEKAITNPMRGSIPVQKVMLGVKLIWERLQTACNYLYTSFTARLQSENLPLYGTTTDVEISTYISEDGLNIVSFFAANDGQTGVIFIRPGTTPYDFNDLESRPILYSQPFPMGTNEARWAYVTSDCSRLFILSRIRGLSYFYNSGNFCEDIDFQYGTSYSFEGGWGSGEWQITPQFSKDGMFLFLGMYGDLDSDQSRIRIFKYRSIAGAWGFNQQPDIEVETDFYDYAPFGDPNNKMRSLDFFFFGEDGNKIIIGFLSWDGDHYISTADLPAAYDIRDRTRYTNWEAQRVTTDHKYMHDFALPNTPESECMERLRTFYWHPTGGEHRTRIDLGSEA
jgi:hypothetical protein